MDTQLRVLRTTRGGNRRRIHHGTRREQHVSSVDPICDRSLVTAPANQTNGLPLRRYPRRPPRQLISLESAKEQLHQGGWALPRHRRRAFPGLPRRPGRPPLGSFELATYFARFADNLGAPVKNSKWDNFYERSLGRCGSFCCVLILLFMDICLFTPSLPPVTGGAETSVQNFALGLAARGVSVHLLVGNQPTTRLAEAVVASGGSVTVPPSPENPWALPWEDSAFARTKALGKLLADRPVDLIHAFSHSTVLSAAMALPAHGSRPPFLLATFHEMSAEDTPVGTCRSRFIYGLERVDLHVAVSDKYYETALRNGLPVDRLRRARQGVRIAEFGRGSRSAGRELLQVPQDGFLLVCPSRFARGKGQLELMAALSKCRRQGKAMKTVLVGSLSDGSGPYFEELQGVIRREGLTDLVSVVSDVPHDRMPDVLAAADVVVQPSHREGLGLAGLETMAVGTCLAASRVSGFNEYCRDGQNCLMFDAKDADGLAVCLERLHDDEALRRALGAAGRKSAESYDSELGVEDNLRIYRELLSLPEQSATVRAPMTSDRR